MIGRAAAVTDPGRTRRHNEDAYVIEPPLFAIADGMGGAQAGEVASRLATAALKEAGADGGGEQRISDLIQAANRRVYDRSSSDPNTSGMGTTITVALVEDDLVSFGHVGDSRAYLIRDAQMEQLTEDHSLVNELLKTGKLSREEAETHPQRSVITRALGTDPDVDVDVFSVEARPGDLFLLCSDGLSTMIDADTISEIVERNRADLASAAHALIKAANDHGGEDNITAVLFELDGALAATQEVPVAAAVEPAPEPAPGNGSEGDTVVVGAAEVTAALAAADAEAAPGPPEGESETETDTEAEGEPFPIFRAILATLLIIVLAAIAIALAMWGLAR
jgi:PPM family protein phosphatase